MNIAKDMDAPELAALLHFYADAGVEWLVEDEPVDRFAQFAAQKAAQAEARAPASARQQQPTNYEQAPNSQAAAATPKRTAPAARAAAPPPASAPVSVPDEQAVASARFAAESARSLDELRTALEAFNGCNLKNGARNTVFASGNPASGIMVIGPMPNADDDRDGIPFSGRQGQLLDRMLGAIGLARDGVLLSNVIPWRPPGNRMPSQAEMDICRPFLERQVALAEPKLLLLLGNFPARFFFGGNGTIHSMRGEWRELSFGGIAVSAIATLHPQELLAAPANKALAWQDLLMFKMRFSGH
ncbi:uracil-DNA glycosylase family protein [Neorhizobium galegae]|uniref:uracil-DNA glycosylase n=1 Tax=Neorhizobium galegae TaxID=399 RepID=UPI000621A5F2|nr:uracil-DNA glycosylase [Neorhizobium galegae]CDZ29383.1 Phage SPO1 DNA polymerase-related protein [Neorhizobium galegae bv. officinalis]KAA9386427.1 uracil-DNA glycosylase [Neorhizobium galegae]KAB1112718.1 uracil-DNA glycosylase [Neorhizobium galegae]MCM2501723.1 uracil-DNA glycosylase [Neorhizobium galegae]MCQ1772110.1 uracil-DNA glycosylase [Neorhizobium galegae]